MKKFILLTILSSLVFATESLPTVKLSGEDGGRLNKKSWSSSEMKDKVHVLFYVDPDEKDLNEHVSQELKKEKFPLDKYASVAVINMAATWLPNFALESALADKQELYPDTTYVKDFKKVLIGKWDLKDDSSNILLFNKSGKLIYKIMGKATDKQKSELINLIKKNL